MLDQHRTGNKSLKELGVKAVVTDYSLAHWLAQSCKLDVHNIPMNQQVPEHLSGVIPPDGRRDNGKVLNSLQFIQQTVKKLFEYEDEKGDIK